MVVPFASLALLAAAPLSPMQKLGFQIAFAVIGLVVIAVGYFSIRNQRVCLSRRQKVFMRLFFKTEELTGRAAVIGGAIQCLTGVGLVAFAVLGGSLIGSGASSNRSTTSFSSSPTDDRFEQMMAESQARHERIRQRHQQMIERSRPGFDFDQRRRERIERVRGLRSAGRPNDSMLDDSADPIDEDAGLADGNDPNEPIPQQTPSTDSVATDQSAGEPAVEDQANEVQASPPVGSLTNGESDPATPATDEPIADDSEATEAAANTMEFRGWTADGSSKSVDARFVEFVGRRVKLQRRDSGKHVVVPIEKLSKQDRQYLKQIYLQQKQAK